MVENYMINPVTMFFLNLALSRQVYGDINVGLYKLGEGGNKNTLLLIFFSILLHEAWTEHLSFLAVP